MARSGGLRPHLSVPTIQGTVEGAVNFMGMGVLELAVVFLVAFLVLGPGKSIEMARTAGKVIRDLRRTFTELAAAVDLEQLDQSADRPAPPTVNTEQDPKGKPGDG